MRHYVSHVDWVDTTEARSQLRDLAAAGYPLSYLSEQLDTSDETLSTIRLGKRKRVAESISHGIAYAHRHLLNVDPASVGIAPPLSTAARNTAARNGWTAGGGRTA